MLSPVTMQFFVKEAAPAHIKRLRNLFSTDKEEFYRYLDGLEAAGKLKYTDQGTNIADFVGGAETVPQAVVGVKGRKGVSVRKVYDPKAPLYSKDFIGRKQEVIRKSRQVDNENIGALQTEFKKGRGGARYSISKFLDDYENEAPHQEAKDAMRAVLTKTQPKIDGIQRRTWRQVTEDDIYGAREAKQNEIISELKRRNPRMKYNPVAQEEAAKRAKKMIPNFGGTYINDLHEGNVVITPENDLYKIMDFNPLRVRDQHALADWYSSTYLPQKEAIERSNMSTAVKERLIKKLEAKRWEFQGGKMPSLDQVVLARKGDSSWVGDGLQSASNSSSLSRKDRHALNRRTLGLL